MVVRTEHFSYMYAAQVVYIMLINGHSAIIHIVRQKVNTIVADPAGYAGSHAATEATTIFNVTTSGAAVYERANNTRTTGDSRLDTIYSGITGEFTPEVFPYHPKIYLPLQISQLKRLPYRLNDFLMPVFINADY